MVTQQIDNNTSGSMVEPQAFVVDPLSDFELYPIEGNRAKKLKEGDDSAGKGLQEEINAQRTKNLGKRPKKEQAEKKTGFLADIEPSRANQEAWDEARQVWDSVGAIAPPYEKDLLARITKLSGVLQECIQAYCTVIEGFGHSFIPTIDAESDGAFEQVKLALWFEKMESGVVDSPTDDEVNVKLASLRREIVFQKMQAERFFTNCSRIEGKPVGFTQLRKRLRQDYESEGEWYLEVLRDGNGKIRRLSFLPSISMRRMPLNKDFTEIEVPERKNDFMVEIQKEKRKFRRFVQVDPDLLSTVFFKELGDPAILSSRSGTYYESLEALEIHEPGVQPATEIITDGIPDIEGPYGVPRWIANSPAIGGSRKAEEVNFSYYDNKTIPPFLILVSGGRLSSQAQERIRTYLKTLKGSDNFHKLLVLEAAPFSANMPGQPPQRVQIEVVPLIKYLNEDGLFLKYLQFNDTRIGANFACPALVRGRSEEYTRATAREALNFFERYVAQPERGNFDDKLNNELMPALGLTLVYFKSLSADNADPEVLTNTIDVLMKHGSLIPRDGRQIAERLLGRELPNIKEPWLDRPMKMTVAELATNTKEIDDFTGSVYKPEASDDETTVASEPPVEDSE